MRRTVLLLIHVHVFSTNFYAIPRRFYCISHKNFKTFFFFTFHFGTRLRKLSPSKAIMSTAKKKDRLFNLIEDHLTSALVSHCIFEAIPKRESNWIVRKTFVQMKLQIVLLHTLRRSKVRLNQYKKVGLKIRRLFY